MSRLENYLSAATRRVFYQMRTVPGAGRLLEPIRGFYAPHYSKNANGWIVMDKYDGDLKIKVDRSSYIGSCIYWRGYHQVHELMLLKQLLSPDMVFADVGANQGEFTIFAAKRLWMGKVLAFEPLESMFQQLMTNIQLNGFENVVAYNFGLSDTAGTAEIYTSTDFTRHRSFHEGLATTFPTNYRSTNIGRVKLELFDEVFEDSGLNRLDIVKIDVEGAELSVLAGGYKTLERYRPVIIIEINEETSNAAGYTRHDVIGLLEKLKYRLFMIRRGGRITPVKRENVPAFCNIMCC
jgi:FkbM family methyltransferase